MRNRWEVAVGVFVSPGGRPLIVVGVTIAVMLIAVALPVGTINLNMLRPF